MAHVATGEMAYCGPTHSEKDQVPEDAGTKRMQSDVDAELIRWLSTNPAASKLVDPRGIRLRGTRVVGQLDLSYATVAFPLTFETSRFDTDIDLAYSQLANFALTSGEIRGITADNMTVRGDFVLSNTNAAGEISLDEATLGGDLNGDGGTFKNPGNYALSSDNLKAANVFLNDGFSADGEVDLMGATLEGDLDGDGGTFRNPGKKALHAEHLKATRVFLDNGFSADGEVDLMGATLAGDLDGAGGTFKNPGKVALTAENLKAVNVYLRDGFSAVGTVDLVEAEIKEAFNWTDLAPAHAAEVVLDLRYATVGPLLDGTKSWPQQGNLRLDGFVYSLFGRTLYVHSPNDAQSRLTWLALQRPKSDQKGTNDNLSTDFAPQPYEQLAKVLRENGDDAGAKRVLYEMENARSSYGKLDFVERLSRGILRVTIGYGYYTWWALWWISGFVILGTFLFFWGHKSDAIVQIDKEKPDHFLSFNPFVYSLETFLPLVELHQAKALGPDPERHHRSLVPLAAFKPLSKCHLQFWPAFGQHLRWYLWFHILMGWFFTSMLIAGITGLVQKG